jgi:hypothetical protein
MTFYSESTIACQYSYPRIFPQNIHNLWKVHIQLRYTVAAIDVKRDLKELSGMETIAKGAQTTICAKALLASLSRLVDAAKEIASGVHRILLGLYNHFRTATYSRPTKFPALLSRLDSRLQRGV